jgi:hypothetical protein
VKSFPRKWSQKDAGVAIFISEKADFKPKLAEIKAGSNLTGGYI